ncbi:G-protein coupled receptor 182-like [Mobula hypostoma]|uniref:G-protein coupled receptor 182-like n=1 Tax=Mobula hypostoma TaxID=723540 RepID=UPI002FC338DB
MEEVTVTVPSDSLHNDNNDHCLGAQCSCSIYVDFEILDSSLIVMYILFFIAGLVENALVLWINWKIKKTKKESYFYVFNLAVADMGAVLTIPFRLMEISHSYEWFWGSFLCKLDAFLYCVNLYSSTFFLTYMTIERYLSLRYPDQALGSRDRRIRWMVCVCLWTLAVVLSIPHYLLYDVFESWHTFCFIDSITSWNIANFFVTICGFVIPFPIIIVSNIFTTKASKASHNTESIRLSKLISVYIIVFMLCWSPFYITTFISAVDWSTNCNMETVISLLHELGKCFTFSHCVVNPIFYNFMQKHFMYHLETNVVKFLPKKYVKEVDNVSISSDTKQIVVIS